MFLRDIKYIELVFSISFFSSLVLEIKLRAWGVLSRCYMSLSFVPAL